MRKTENSLISHREKFKLHMYNYQLVTRDLCFNQSGDDFTALTFILF